MILSGVVIILQHGVFQSVYDRLMEMMKLATDREKLSAILSTICDDFDETPTAIVAGKRRYHFNDAGEVVSVYDYTTRKRYTEKGVSK